VIVPFFGDQHFWAARLAALGVGPAAVPVDAGKFARAMERALAGAVWETGVRERAAGLGELVRKEDGCQRAVEALERVAEGGGVHRARAAV
jgi:sterol 3beta-glucosyltransferase